VGELDSSLVGGSLMICVKREGGGKWSAVLVGTLICMHIMHTSCYKEYVLVDRYLHASEMLFV
jgi:hypothetical protein